MKAKIWIVTLLLLAVTATAVPVITLESGSVQDQDQLNDTLNQASILDLTVSDSSKIIYSLNNASYVELEANATSASTSAGAISFTQGNNTLRIVAIEDENANDTMVLNILLDTTNPTASVSFSPSSTQPGQTNVVLSWDLDDTNYQSSWISLTDPTGSVLTNSTDDDSNHAILASNVLAGNYTADYQVLDVVGNKLEGSTTLQVSNDLPEVTLHSPSNETVQGEDYIEIECSATDVNLTSLTVYHNNDQSFGAEEEKDANTSQRIKFNLTNLDSESFIWNCKAEDTTGQSSYASENRTIIIDDINPSISALSPTDGYGTLKKEVTFQWVATDNRNNTISCELWVDKNKKKTTNIQDGDSVEFKFDFDDGEHNWTVNCEDEVGNIINTSQRKFSIDTGTEAKAAESSETKEVVEKKTEEEVKTPEVKTIEKDDSETKVMTQTQEVKLPSEQEQEPGTLERLAKALGGRFTFKKSLWIAGILMALTIVVLGMLGLKEYSKDNILFKVKVRKYKFMAKKFYERHIKRNKKYY